ncbi:ASCH domain protein [compost metagenome]
MKAITIIQPWATLIAINAKQHETRSWKTNYRGELAIHAAKKIDIDACEREPIKSILAEHGYKVDNLPTGAVVAIATLSDCQSSIGEKYQLREGVWEDGYYLSDETFIGYPEYELGDFTPGRFAWELSNVQQLAEPIPAKGQQGFWNWEGSL